MKCIALDLDGTTLYDDKFLTKRTENAIRAALDKGIQVVIASGRCMDSLPDSVTQIPGIEYAITSNGAAIYHLPTGKCLLNYPISPKSVEQIIALASEHSCAFEVFYEGKAYAEASYIKNPAPYGISHAEYVQRTRSSVPDIFSFMRTHQKELYGVDILTADEALYDILYQDISRLPDVYVTSSVKGRIETVSKKAGKHAGLAYILERSGILPEEAASFGNADNDIDMLRFAGIGFAVKNASPGCLAAADKILPGNREDGVAVGIEELLHLNVRHQK